MEPVIVKEEPISKKKPVQKWTEEEKKEIIKKLNATNYSLTDEQFREAMKNSARGFVELNHTSEKLLQRTRPREKEIQYSTYDIKKQEIKTNYTKEIEKLKIKFSKASIQTFYEPKVCTEEEMSKFSKEKEEIKYKYGKKLLDLKNCEEMNGKRKLEMMEKDELEREYEAELEEVKINNQRAARQEFFKETVCSEEEMDKYKKELRQLDKEHLKKQNDLRKKYKIKQGQIDPRQCF
jgi:hypothetical protein